MTNAEQRLTLALALTPGIGGKSLVRVTTRNTILSRSPEEFLNLSEAVLKEEYSMKANALAAWQSAKEHYLKEAGELASLMRNKKIHLVTAASANYPDRVEAMDPDPPALLYLYGNTKLLHLNTFCALSSRNPPSAALDAIEVAAEKAVLEGKVIVSGHDNAAYQRAAIVPLRWGAPRILVLDRGLFAALGDDLNEEPFRAARLWRYQFDPLTDLAVSAHKPHTPYAREANKLRDRLVASLADELVFAWIKGKGNMDALARRAIRAGRRVSVASICEGRDEFLHAGAKPLETPQTC